MARPAGSTRVLLAGDPLVRAGLRYRLRKASEVAVVGDAEGGPEAARLARELPADVLLLDGLAAHTVLNTVRALRAAAPGVRVVVMSGVVSAHQARALARLGVGGYLARTATTGELRRALRVVHAGRFHVENLRRKAGMVSRSELLRLARERGWIG
jgi:DNA-binding NarL/FixJ family response regulator